MAKCPVLVAFNTEGNASLLYCGRWNCPVCSKTNAGRWAKRVQLGIEGMTENVQSEAWFLTLTLGSYYERPEEGYKALPRLWDSTRKSFQRYYGGFLYVAFVEAQPKGRHMPHFHILTDRQPPWRRGRRGYVTKRGVHDFAVSLGWGFEANLEIVTSGQAAVYVAKYTSKGDPSMPRSFRRVRCSRDFPALPDLGGSPLLVPAKAEDVAHFIARVADETGVDPDTLYPRYLQATKALYTERQSTSGTLDNKGSGV